MFNVSIIIPTVTPNLIEACLKSLSITLPENAEYIDVHVILDVDLGGVKSLFSDDFPCPLMWREKHSFGKRGYASSCNYGWKYSMGDWILTLNDDTIFQPGWYEGLRVISGGGTDAIYGAKLMASNGWNCVDGITYPYIEGWGIFFHRSMLKSVGFMREEFDPCYFEDAEYSARAVMLGKRLEERNFCISHAFNKSADRFQSDFGDLAAITFANKKKYEDLIRKYKEGNIEVVNCYD